MYEVEQFQELAMAEADNSVNLAGALVRGSCHACAVLHSKDEEELLVKAAPLGQT